MCSLIVPSSAKTAVFFTLPIATVQQTERKKICQVLHSRQIVEKPLGARVCSQSDKEEQG